MGDHDLVAAALIGTFDETEKAILRNAFERGGAIVVTSPSIDIVKRELSEIQPKCVCVNAEEPELTSTVAWIREHESIYSTPVIALVSDLRDRLFVQAYRDGADDVIVRSNDGGVTRRIANLSRFDPMVRPPVMQGPVLVGHSGDEDRRSIGRVLRQAGFKVIFATDLKEVTEALDRLSRPKIVVASEDIVPSSSIDDLRKRVPALRHPLPFILVTSDADTRTTLNPTLESVAIVSATAPPDHLLFLANDLLGGNRIQGRQSLRFLFDTICSFRSEGEFEREYGLTYNISEHGIYVRTLDPPPKAARLWIELRPPGTASTVQLRGKLVWKAMLDTGPRATPPGFGLQIDTCDSLPSDLAIYRNAYYTRASRPNEVEIS